MPTQPPPGRGPHDAAVPPSTEPPAETKRTAADRSGGRATEDPVPDAATEAQDRSPAARQTPTTSAPQAVAAGPVAAAPVFIESEAPATAPSQTWWPLLATALMVCAAGGLIWWRRRY